MCKYFHLQASLFVEQQYFFPFWVWASQVGSWLIFTPALFVALTWPKWQCAWLCLHDFETSAWNQKPKKLTINQLKNCYECFYLFLSIGHLVLHHFWFHLSNRTGHCVLEGDAICANSATVAVVVVSGKRFVSFAVITVATFWGRFLQLSTQTKL